MFAKARYFLGTFRLDHFHAVFNLSVNSISSSPPSLRRNTRESAVIHSNQLWAAFVNFSSILQKIVSKTNDLKSSMPFF